LAAEKVEGVSEEGVCLITHDNQPRGARDNPCVEALVGYNQ